MPGDSRVRPPDPSVAGLDDAMVALYRSLRRWAPGLVVFAWGVIVARLTNELSAQDANFTNLLPRTFWPADRPTNLLSLVAAAVVVLVPVASWLVKRRYASRGLGTIVARLLMAERDSSLSQYASICLQLNLTLQSCPFMVDGWPVGEVRVDVLPGDYKLPPTLLGGYETFRRDHSGARWVKQDQVRAMLVKNPTSFSDGDRLSLVVRRTMTSVAKFTSNRLASDPHGRGELIRKAVDDLEIEFPHVFCLQPVVVTSDDRVLLTRRSEKVEWYPGSWSCSIEEQMSEEDLVHPPMRRLVEWTRRALREELGLYADYEPEPYTDEGLKLLSVFVEGDNMNVSLCAYVHLDITAAALDPIIKAHPRPDYEFTEWAFLGLRELAEEVLRPTRHQYHPTSRYRMLMCLLHRYGEAGLARGLQRAMRR